MNEIKVGDMVQFTRGERYKVVRLVSVFGIPAADLVRIRKDGSEYAVRGRLTNVKNLPLSVLELVK